MPKAPEKTKEQSRQLTEEERGYAEIGAQMQFHKSFDALSSDTKNFGKPLSIKVIDSLIELGKLKQKYAS
jgi:hypothetical protein